MSRETLFPCVVACVLAASSGCTFDAKGISKPPGSTTGNGGTGIVAPVFDGAVADRGTMTGLPDGGQGAGLTPDANCGYVQSTLMNAPADLLIVLDRSGSMLEDSTGMACAGGCGATSKWTQMTTAIEQVAMTTQNQVNWGLKFFGSDKAGCNVNPGVEVPPVTANSAAITAAITANMPGSSTPTRAGIMAAGTYLTALADGNPKYIILATDGIPNCAAVGGQNAGDDAAAIAAVGAVATGGIPVFVIGIATNDMATMTLNGMAMAGGRPQAGAQQYYLVSNTADLVTVLGTLQGMIMRSCTYHLPQVPPNPENVKVTVAGNRIERDTTHTTGWDYSPDMMSIIFFGGLCDQLTAGTAGDVNIILGCGTMAIP
jgi:von Willebrand factor type A domain